ncbi:MAG: anthranilate phosphoribosyltransferase [Gemmatimonadales bacterium]|nr:MAG: anthranilate phosphoribosyltransferase [Gemmatimonadales bacterium]
MTDSDSSSLPAILSRIAHGHVLTVDEAEAAFDTVMEGQASPVQTAALLMGLRARGHAPSEVAGGVRALRRAMIPVSSARTDELVDTCGTGGGKVSTFNVSTAAALVAAGAGVPVAKHGNRSFTSRSGSADVLEALGVRIQLSPEAMAQVLEEAGIVFMFAPLLHPAMRHVGPVRRELAIPTIMNLLGPLTNPAGVRRQVVGVADPELLPLLGEALRTLEHLRALVVHGRAGLDEVSPLGETEVVELRDGAVAHYTIRPEELGLPTATLEEIAGGEPSENALRIRSVLEGRDRGGARTFVLLNAAAALYVAGRAESLEDGVRQAAEAVDGGAALRTLAALVETSRAAAED